MERSKSIISIVVGLAAILIIWRVGFYPPGPASEKVQEPVKTETEVAAEPNAPAEVNEPMVSLDDSRSFRPRRIRPRPVESHAPQTVSKKPRVRWASGWRDEKPPVMPPCW